MIDQCEKLGCVMCSWPETLRGCEMVPEKFLEDITTQLTTIAEKVSRLQSYLATNYVEFPTRGGFAQILESELEQSRVLRDNYDYLKGYVERFAKKDDTPVLVENNHERAMCAQSRRLCREPMRKKRRTC